MNKKLSQLQQCNAHNFYLSNRIARRFNPFNRIKNFANKEHWVWQNGSFWSMCVCVSILPWQFSNASLFRISTGKTCFPPFPQEARVEQKAEIWWTENTTKCFLQSSKSNASVRVCVFILLLIDLFFYAGCSLDTNSSSKNEHMCGVYGAHPYNKWTNVFEYCCCCWFY